MIFMSWQKQIMIEFQTITEKAGLRWNAEYLYSNIGDVYIVDGLLTKLSFHFNFQNDCTNLQFYPEGIQPVGTCGFTDSKCVKNFHIQYIDNKKLEELFSFFNDKIKEIKQSVNSKEKERLEIDKMITLSTSHITEAAETLLDYYCGSNEGFPVYKKAEYGWFMYLGPEIAEKLSDIPEELANVIQFVLKHECVWLCLDRFGDETTELPTYEW
jgi:hypothetical protein